MSYSNRSDDELLALTKREPRAFGVVYERHAPALMRYLLRRTGSPELAADLTAEVFAAALQASGRFKPGPAPVRAWLFGIANNKLADSRRRRRVETRARQRLGMRELRFSDGELDRVEQLYDIDQCGSRLWELVDDLPEAQRKAALARVVDEREYSEMATALGASEQTLRQRVNRALNRLAHRTMEEQA